MLKFSSHKAMLLQPSTTQAQDLKAAAQKLKNIKSVTASIPISLTLLIILLILSYFVFFLSPEPPTHSLLCSHPLPL